MQQANHYTLYNRHGQIVGYMAEENTSMSGTVMRQVAGSCVCVSVCESMSGTAVRQEAGSLLLLAFCAEAPSLPCFDEEDRFQGLGCGARSVFLLFPEEV